MVVLLAAVLVPVALLTAWGLVALWPDGAAPDVPFSHQDVEYVRAEVRSSTTSTCEGTDEDRLADGTVPGTVPCTLLTVAAEPSGQAVEVWAPSTVGAAEVPAGTRVVLARYAAAGDQPEVWAWHDHDRAVPLLTLAGAFAVVVVAVAGLRGLRAVVGLALAFVVLAVFMLPALLRGGPPVAIALTGSSAIMFVVLYMAHGFSRRTTTALLGTLVGLALTAGLGVLAAGAAHLRGTSTEDGYRLAMYTGQLDGPGLRGIFLCGLVLAGLGVLNDVTITQASAVWELRASDPAAGRRELFRRGMRIGRDHIASTVYTIAFAYAGAALPVLLLLEVYRMPLVHTLTSGEFAEEVARTLVGSIGLTLAIPLTTAIAVAVLTAGGPPRSRHRVPDLAHHH